MTARNVFIYQLQVLGIVIIIKVGPVAAECSLDSLCLEMKIVVICLSTITVCAVVGFIIIATKGCFDCHRTCRRCPQSIETKTTKTGQANTRKTRVKSVREDGVVIYDEIEEINLTEASRGRKNVNRDKYESVVFQRKSQDSETRYDSLVNRRRKSKGNNPKGHPKRKSRRIRLLQFGKSLAKENEYMDCCQGNSKNALSTSDASDSLQVETEVTNEPSEKNLQNIKIGENLAEKEIHNDGPENKGSEEFEKATNPCIMAGYTEKVGVEKENKEADYNTNKEADANSDDNKRKNNYHLRDCNTSDVGIEEHNNTVSGYLEVSNRCDLDKCVLFRSNESQEKHPLPFMNKRKAFGKANQYTDEHQTLNISRESSAVKTIANVKPSEYKKRYNAEHSSENQDLHICTTVKSRDGKPLHLRINKTSA